MLTMFGGFLLFAGGLLGFCVGREASRREKARLAAALQKQGRFICQVLKVEAGGTDLTREAQGAIEKAVVWLPTDGRQRWQ